MLFVIIRAWRLLIVLLMGGRCARGRLKHGMACPVVLPPRSNRRCSFIGPTIQRRNEGIVSGEFADFCRSDGKIQMGPKWSPSSWFLFLLEDLGVSKTQRTMGGTDSGSRIYARELRDGGNDIGPFKRLHGRAISGRVSRWGENTPTLDRARENNSLAYGVVSSGFDGLRVG